MTTTNDTEKLLSREEATEILDSVMQELLKENCPDIARFNAVSELCNMVNARLSFNDAIAIAKGCFDYGGGYRSSNGELEIFHHGIQTVINALEGAKESRLTDLQSRVLHFIGCDSNKQKAVS